MYPTSFRLFRQLLPLVALAVIGELAIMVIKEKIGHASGLIVASIVIWAYLAFNTHTELLLPARRNKTEDNRRLLGFVLRFFGLGVLVAVPLIMILAVLFWDAFANSQMQGNEMPLLLTALGLLAVCFLVVFGFFGTLLPAFVADRGRGLSAAFSRGQSQFLWIITRFIVGPIVVFGIAQAVIFGGILWMAPHIDLLTASYIPNIPLFLILITGYVIQALGTIMVAWVLSAAFLRAEGSA